jgi:pimeloyl-ACP methyl ester carboxylesterase
MSKPTRDGNRKFWGQILVVHPERLDDGVLDADVAGQLRNTESHLGLVASIADAGGLRRKLIFGDRWMALTTRTLILWGERDAFLAPRDGEGIAAANPSVRVMRIPDAGHLPWHDAPESVVIEMEGFLSGAETPESYAARMPRG